MLSKPLAVTGALIVGALVLTAGTSLHYAPTQDLLEVQGLGALTGRLIEDDGDHIRFKSKEFGEAVYLRSDVRLMGRAEAQGFYGLTVRMPHLEKLSTRSAWDTLNGLLTGDTFARGLRRAAVSEIRDVLYDGRDPAELCEILKREILYTLSRPGSRHLTPLRLTGAALVVVSLLCMAYFTAQLLGALFSEGLLWTAALLVLTCFWAGERLSGAAPAYLAVLATAVALYLLALRWEATRSALIGQIFSLNAGLIGTLILRVS